MRTLLLPLVMIAGLGLAACPGPLQPPVEGPAWTWLEAQHPDQAISATYEVHAEEETAVCGVVAAGEGAEAQRRRYVYRMGAEGEAGEGWLGEAVIGDGPHWTEPQCLEQLDRLDAGVAAGPPQNGAGQTILHQVE